MIERYLRFRCSNEFAHWRDSTDNTVYYSQPRTIGSVTWPAEVVLIQSLKSLGKDPYNTSMGVYPRLSMMGRGLTRNHLRMAVTEHGDQLTGAAMPPPATCKALDAEGVLNRNLAGAAWLTTFASPNVDLANQGQYLHRLYMMAAFRLTAIKVGGNASKRAAGHNIGALLVQNDGKIIAGALNTGAWPNTSLHAEVNMVQVYTGAGSAIPPACFVYTTMKPCDMCAALLAELASTCTVIYQQNDPGTVGTIAPLGGIRQIDTMGVKSPRVYDDALAKTGSLGISITQTRSTKSNLNLTKFVDTPEMLGVMKSAQRGLERKAQRYASGVQKRPEVVAVLKHIGANLGIIVNDPPPPPPPQPLPPDLQGLPDEFWDEYFAPVDLDPPNI